MILCDDCFKRFGPMAERCCTHGCGNATCGLCGAKRRPKKPFGQRDPSDPPYWHCIDGNVAEQVHSRLEGSGLGPID